MQKSTEDNKRRRKIRIALSSMLAVFVGVSLFVGSGLFTTLKASAQSVTAPTASNGSYSVNENTSFAGTLIGSDTNSPALPLTYSIVSYPANGVLSNVSTSSDSFTYTPAANFTGQDSFTFMVNNGTDNSADATETITVNSATSTTATSTAIVAPVATAGYLSVAENGSSTGMLMASDTNSPVLPLTYSIVSYPANGFLSNVSTSSDSFTYTPTAGFTGQDSFTFMVNNGTDNSAVATEMVTVNPATSTTTTSTAIVAPVASGGSLSVAENSSESGTLIGSDTNSPVLPLTYSIVSNPVDGTLSGVSTSSGSFTYTPNSGFVGSDSFTFMVNNGTDNSGVATEMITVNAMTSTSSSTQVLALEAQIQQLEQEILSLLQQLIASKGGGGTTGTGPGTSTTTMGTPTISPQNATVTAGTSIDFGGRDFAANEPVTVSLNGQTVDTAQADGGGNFSTGSLSVPSNASGTLTYSFTGQSSGTVLTDSITVVP